MPDDSKARITKAEVKAHRGKRASSVSCDDGIFRPGCQTDKMAEPVKKDGPCHGVPLWRRHIEAQPGTWRAAPDASDRTLPKFYLHEEGGTDFSAVGSELRRVIGKHRYAEEVVPVAFSQYLVDLPVIESLRMHPKRTRDPSAAAWHVLGAMPFASKLLAALQANVTADGNHVCLGAGQCTPMLANGPELAPHRARLQALTQTLRTDPFWTSTKKPFVLLATEINVLTILDEPLIRTMLTRNRRGAPVILAGVDRSGPHSLSTQILPLLRRMVVLPHVATPECTRLAAVAHPTTRSSHWLPNDLDSTKRPGGGGGGRGRHAMASSSSSAAVTALPVTSTRSGFLFHGSDARYVCTSFLLLALSRGCMHV